MNIEIKDELSMKSFGRKIGSLLKGGENIELVGDVGAGKTTLVKGLAVGLGIDENIQSPSFTINRLYGGRDGILLSHYDFYRLSDAGILSDELSEAVNDEKTVTVIEWAEAVSNILPVDRLVIEIVALSDFDRKLTIKSGGFDSNSVLNGLMK